MMHFLCLQDVSEEFRWTVDATAPSPHRRRMKLKLKIITLLTNFIIIMLVANKNSKLEQTFLRAHQVSPLSKCETPRENESFEIGSEFRRPSSMIDFRDGMLLRAHARLEIT